mmetsp:Transcript_61040/g.173411  ORF Transcript_61040/g.173411 Transcript_61040/m.173411 type:complete len:239 (+) Transcript_61040:239-955(+)
MRGPLAGNQDGRTHSSPPCSFCPAASFGSAPSAPSPPSPSAPSSSASSSPPPPPSSSSSPCSSSCASSFLSFLRAAFFGRLVLRPSCTSLKNPSILSSPVALVYLKVMFLAICILSPGGAPPFFAGSAPKNTSAYLLLLPCSRPSAFSMSGVTFATNTVISWPLFCRWSFRTGRKAIWCMTCCRITFLIRSACSVTSSPCVFTADQALSSSFLVAAKSVSNTLFCLASETFSAFISLN